MGKLMKVINKCVHTGSANNLFDKKTKKKHTSNNAAWIYAVPWVCLQFVIVVFPDHTHLLFYMAFLHATEG